MVRARRRVRWMAAVAAVALTTAGCGVSLQALPKPSSVSGSTYTVHATFGNVVNLPADAEVRQGAFTVGYVSGLTAKDFKAQVTMRIKTSVKLPVGTTAEVRFDTPLGEDYVSVQQPSAPTGGGAPIAEASAGAGLPGNVTYIGNGSVIPEDQTSTAPSVEDVFGALGALLNGGGIDQLQTIIHELNNAFGGNQTQIRELLPRLADTITAFAQSAPQLDTALAQIGNLSQVLNRSSGAIVEGISALAPASQVLAGQTQQLTQLVDQVGQLSTVANQVITASQRGLVTTLQRLQPVLTQLTDVRGQLGPALNAVDELEVTLGQAAPGGYLQASLNATIKVPPVPAGALPLQRVTVDPPDPNESYQRSGIATMLEGGLP